jgi:L-asparaginase
MPLPRVVLLSLGGTIAMTADGRSGVAPRLDSADLVAAVPELAQVADVTAQSFRRLPGAHLTLADIGALAGAIAEHCDRGADGVVVTQGTDTLEETALVLDLLLAEQRPVVITGAMRNPTVPGADGPANLLAATQVAASPAARGLGVLVVANATVHAARFVRKAHTQRPDAFVSAPGPLGWISEGTPRIMARPVPSPRLPVSVDGPQRVALITTVLDDDGHVLRSAVEGDWAGIVIEALGGGHVAPALIEPLGAAASRMPVVLCSRTGAGEVLRGTYDFAGSERDLLARGAIWGGWLDGPKARILLTLLLRGGLDRDAIAAAFAAYLAGEG